MTRVAMSGHYAQQAQAFVLRLPEHLEESVRARLKTGGMDGVQLTARPDGFEGLRECCREGREAEGLCLSNNGGTAPVELRATSRELGMDRSSPSCVFQTPPPPPLLLYLFV